MVTGQNMEKKINLYKITDINLKSEDIIYFVYGLYVRVTCITISLTSITLCYECVPT